MSTPDLFFDGGWCWMRHPSRNDGNAIPVKMQTVDGERYYYPLDPTDATEFAWDDRDDEWEIVAPWNDDTDREFALFCAKAAGGHLSTLVDDLRAENAYIRQSRDSLLSALQRALDALGGECFDWGPARAVIEKATNGSTPA